MGNGKFISCKFKISRKFKREEISIIGCGNVGNLLAKTLTKLGLQFVICDPFIKTKYNQVNFEQALKSDILTFHTPLTYKSSYKTYHLLNHQNLKDIAFNTWILNSSRGSVFDNNALLNYDFKFLSLDVFENEPLVNIQLIEKCNIATPHIAGYSKLGRVYGSIMIYQALCDFLDIQEDAQLVSNLLKQDKINVYLPNNISFEEDGIL